MVRILTDTVEQCIKAKWLTDSPDLDMTSLTPEMASKFRQEVDHEIATAQVLFLFDGVRGRGPFEMKQLATWKTEDDVIYNIHVHHEARRWQLGAQGRIDQLKSIPEAFWNASKYIRDSQKSVDADWNPLEMAVLIKQATELNMWSRRAHTYSLLAEQAYRFPQEKQQMPPTWRTIQQFSVSGGNLLTVCYGEAHKEV
ncbi:hypothetical protein BV898_10099 [Hypsibius exemplaris]|uniref:Uncharacterized protein n=1 Tax=Hypsibius exemplaris TaxID=2072580 RepID=A0A1W0WKR6_HYPEX|nr:hypothetical protein BV898_10099 [Hypsibius exemplaris]